MSFEKRNRDCFRAHPGDRLGIHVTDDPIPITYGFQENSNVLWNIGDDRVDMREDETVIDFKDALSYPYVPSIVVFVDQGGSLFLFHDFREILKQDNQRVSYVCF